MRVTNFVITPESLRYAALAEKMGFRGSTGRSYLAKVDDLVLRIVEKTLVGDVLLCAVALQLNNVQVPDGVDLLVVHDAIQAFEASVRSGLELLINGRVEVFRHPPCWRAIDNMQAAYSELVRGDANCVMWRGQRCVMWRGERPGTNTVETLYATAVFPRDGVGKELLIWSPHDAKEKSQLLIRLEGGRYVTVRHFTGNYDKLLSLLGVCSDDYTTAELPSFICGVKGDTVELAGSVANLSYSAGLAYPRDYAGADEAVAPYSSIWVRGGSVVVQLPNDSRVIDFDRGQRATIQHAPKVSDGALRYLKYRRLGLGVESLALRSAYLANTKILIIEVPFGNNVWWITMRCENKLPVKVLTVSIIDPETKWTPHINLPSYEISAAEKRYNQNLWNALPGYEDLYSFTGFFPTSKVSIVSIGLHQCALTGAPNSILFDDVPVPYGKKVKPEATIAAAVAAVKTIREHGGVVKHALCRPLDHQRFTKEHLLTLSDTLAKLDVTLVTLPALLFKPYQG